MATETTKITYVEGAAPATPGAATVETYAKADGLMYSKDDAGTETLMSSGGTATRASLGLATSDSPEFAAVNVGASTDTTVTRTGAGEIAVEGNRIFRVGGADVPIADGGTGASTATAAFDALSPMTTAGDLIVGGASGTRTRLGVGTNGEILTLVAGAPSWEPNTGVADILDLPTAETDDTLVLAPDGAGGVEFRAETGGGGGGTDNWLIEVNPAAGSHGHTNWNTLNTSGGIGGSDVESSGAQNDEIYWDLGISGGTWDVTLVNYRGTNRGIYTVSIDAVSIGTIDGYANPGGVNSIGTITGVSIAAGKRRLKLKMATKNGSSSNYFGTIQWIQLRRTA